MKLTIYQVDAFTSQVFKGNYAAVIVLEPEFFPEQQLSTELMQDIASENNLSETAFVTKISEDEYHIRWFSPINEIAFCGHASLASAFILFELNKDLSKLRFFADAIGHLELTKLDNACIQMAAPVMMPKHLDSPPKHLIKALNIQPCEILQNQQAYFAVYERQDDVAKLSPNLDLLKLLGPLDLVVTAKGQEHDFVCRYFWPANGGDEDPVTGSIHAGLAPYWAKKLNKPCLRSYQMSKRGGELYCQVKGDLVLISGQAVCYMKGDIYI